jgi:hypothetical protein
MDKDSGASRARLAWVALACIVLLVVAAEVLSATTGSGIDPTAFAVLAFPIIGALIASRQPDNAIGWIMLAIGGVVGIAAILESYAYFVLTARPGALLGGSFAVALAAHTWIPVIGISGTFLILLFPDGRLPTPRWRPWAYFCAVSMVLCYIVLTLYPTSFGDAGYPEIRNPVGVEAIGALGESAILIVLSIPIAIVGCAVGLIRRFRRSHGRDRLQLKWLAGAAGIVAVTYFTLMVLNFVFPGDSEWLTIAGNITIATFLLIPISIGVAILRHRLYDIDVIINRTLVYGGLTATLTAAYYLVVTALQALLSPVAGQSPLVVAGSTLVVAGIFRPARGRIQAFVDRRFYRSRFDAEATVQTFSARLREEVDLEALTSDLLAVVDQTMRPATASLWLRPIAESTSPPPGGGPAASSL